MELYGRKFRCKQGFSEDEMNHWMLRETIQRHHLEILASHPPSARSKEVVLELIVNFEANKKRVWIKGRYYNIIPSVVTDALGCGYHHREDEQIYKEWIKYYGTKITVRALGESLCYVVQAKWKNKKDAEDPSPTK